MASLNSTGQEVDIPTDIWVNEEIWNRLFVIIYRPFMISVSICLGGFFCLYGMVTNIINLAVFGRQGILSDSCTFCLALLALSDFFVCFFNSVVVAGDIFTVFGITHRYPKFLPEIYADHVGRKPALSFVQLSCMVTVYIALERCYSVVRPFQVKQIFTVKRTCVVMCCLVLGNFAFEIPGLISHLPVWDDGGRVLGLFPSYNMTAVLRVLNINLEYFFPRVTFKRYEALPDDILSARENISKFGIRPLCLLAVFVFNLTIYAKVNQSKKFKDNLGTTTSKYQKQSRRDSKNGNESSTIDQSSTRVNTASKIRDGYDEKTRTLLRMISVLCTVFLASNLVTVVMHLIYVTAGKRSQQNNAFNDTFNALIQFFDTVNSAINFNIFYTMSSRYKKEINKLCSCRQPKRNRKTR